MKKTEKATAATVEAPVTTIKNVTISKASEVLVNLTSTAKAKSVSLKDQHLADFLAIESESAARGQRTALLVTLADLINVPFRTVTTEGNGTVVQVSSQWLKQHDPVDIKAAFKHYCDRGHVVHEELQTHFDSTFTRPCFTYTCPKCGISFTKSYRMRKELNTYACKCGTSLTEFTIV